MPVMDYTQKAETSKKKLMSREDITLKNKEHLKRFFKAYETQVSPARQNIFHTHIWQFLNKTNDLSKDMNDKDLINNIFHSLKKQLSLSHYATVYAVSKKFARWLNDNETPKGFKDSMSPKKKDLKRKLSKEDMWEWEDGLRLANNCLTTQWKAIIMTQLDGGFRPSEFADLNYGDISKKDKFIIAHIKTGKTGERDVILYKSVPYLQKWLDTHPSKNPKDPLWVMEYDKKSSRKEVKSNILRYQYTAIAKRLKIIAEKIKLDKPADFYNLRHSACRLAKLDNMPVELASKKFGHSTDFFVNTYARLDVSDDIDRHSEHLGLDEGKEKKKDHTVFCDTCKFINPPKTELCEQCGHPLTIAKAMEIKSNKDKEIENLKQEMSEVKNMLKQMWKDKKI